jgi:hypothetical protein
MILKIEFQLFLWACFLIMNIRSFGMNETLDELFRKASLSIKMKNLKLKAGEMNNFDKGWLHFLNILHSTSNIFKIIFLLLKFYRK